MTKANPKAWFTNSIAKITYSSVDGWAEKTQRFRPYFSTWKEAHEWMVTNADSRLDCAKQQLKRAISFSEKVKSMKEPGND